MEISLHPETRLIKTHRYPCQVEPVTNKPVAQFGPDWLLNKCRQYYIKLLVNAATLAFCAVSVQTSSVRWLTQRLHLLFLWDSDPQNLDELSHVAIVELEDTTASVFFCTSVDADKNDVLMEHGESFRLSQITFFWIELNMKAEEKEEFLQ